MNKVHLPLVWLLLITQLQTASSAIEEALGAWSHPQVVILDIGAQPMILGVGFSEKVGLFHSKLQSILENIQIASSAN